MYQSQEAEGSLGFGDAKARARSRGLTWGAAGAKLTSVHQRISGLDTASAPAVFEGPARVYVCAQSCRTLCDPVGCSPLDSSVLGILQARTLGRVPFPPQGIFLTQRWKVHLLHQQVPLTASPGKPQGSQSSFSSSCQAPLTSNISWLLLRGKVTVSPVLK